MSEPMSEPDESVGKDVPKTQPKRRAMLRRVRAKTEGLLLEIENALKNNGTKTGAAVDLGVHRSTVQRVVAESTRLVEALGVGAVGRRERKVAEAKQRHEERRLAAQKAYDESKAKLDAAQSQLIKDSPKLFANHIANRMELMKPLVEEVDRLKKELHKLQ